MTNSELLNDDQLELAVGGLATDQKERVFSVKVDAQEDYQLLCKAVHKAGNAVSLSFQEEKSITSLLASAVLNMGVGIYEVSIRKDAEPKAVKTL